MTSELSRTMLEDVALTESLSQQTTSPSSVKAV